MSKLDEERLEAYRELREQHPNEPLRFFAARFGVDVSTVSRWNRRLRKLDLEGEVIDDIEARLRVEYEAKLRGILEERDRDLAERELKKREEEERASENRHAYFKRILDECQQVDIYPSETVDVTWQGFRITLIGGVKNTVPEVIAGVWQESQEARRRAGEIIQFYSKGQHLGKLGRTR